MVVSEPAVNVNQNQKDVRENLPGYYWDDPTLPPRYDPTGDKPGYIQSKAITAKDIRKSIEEENEDNLPMCKGCYKRSQVDYQGRQVTVMFRYVKFFSLKINFLVNNQIYKFKIWRCF